MPDTETDPKTSSTERRTCQAFNKNGEPCGAVGVMPDGFCFFHSPNISQEAKLLAVKKGSLTLRRVLPDSAPIRLRSGKECLGVLERVATAVQRGTLDYRIGSTIANLINVAAHLVEVHLLERRIALLESKNGNGRRD